MWLIWLHFFSTFRSLSLVVCTHFATSYDAFSGFSMSQCTRSASAVATFSRLKSGSWRAQIRRKGKYVNETFQRRKDAEERRIDIEHRIDQQEPATSRKSRDARFFGELIALHRQDLVEVGKNIGRSKSASLILLDERLACGGRRRHGRQSLREDHRRRLGAAATKYFEALLADAVRDEGRVGRRQHGAEG
ncbi:hypothetical protein [Rhodopseudomonas sp. BAL398]|nr:hypothetical protein [Rhodopseudomonas sp. BAL398]MDF3808872.1 hypothetical protein [Rhodopseudomonas sp. BAL398]WOK19830.1 hypothetical protein RBJ75_10055 [Rhodopseudomonas sp. BAL398]